MIRGRFLRCFALSSAIIYERERNIMHIPENYLILSYGERGFAIGARERCRKREYKNRPYLYLYEVYTYVISYLVRNVICHEM